MLNKLSLDNKFDN